jgi:AcrR family transcriptional regulator
MVLPDCSAMEAPSGGTTAPIGADVRPWGITPDLLDVRRRELYALAAPVFRASGYRGATIKALAHACHLSPAGLYHYFTSKADLATYIVRRPHLEWQTVHVDPAVDPLVQLRGMIDLAIRELPDFLLALDMADELDVPGMARLRRGLFAEGEAIIGRYIAAVRPNMTQAAAREVAGLVLALLVGSHEIGDAVPATVVTTRERIIRVLRAELVPVAVESARFDRAMAEASPGR